MALRREMRVVAAVLFALVVVDEVVAQEALGVGRNNSTSEYDEGNEATFRTLLEGGASRMDMVANCERAVKDMKFKHVDTDLFSFPPPGFVPEGTAEWCQCIVANPPEIRGFRPLRSYGDDFNVGDLDDYRSLVPQGLRDAYDASFNQCRAQVLDGSNINTVDICRGMFSLFGGQMNTLLVSFCGRLCKDPPRTSYPSHAKRPEFLFNYSCADQCAREAMPGYCRNTLLEYSGFTTMSVVTIDAFYTRKTNVNGVTYAEGFGVPKNYVDALCSAISPTVGGKNDCCNYPKAFSAFSKCCTLNEDSLAVFDCETLYSDQLIDHCVDWIGGFGQSYCRSLVEPYLANLDKYEGTLKIYGSRIRFPDEIMSRICTADGFYEEGTTCCGLNLYTFATNCTPLRATDEYKGVVKRARRLTEPTPGAPVDPCRGACSEGMECVVAQNGVPFCVECSALLRPVRGGGEDVECCRYDASRRRCVTDRKGLQPGTCKRHHNLFVVDDEGTRKRATFRSKRGYACSNPRDFRRNRKACVVLISSTGRARCFF